MRDAGLDWLYRHPELQIMNLGPAKEVDPGGPDPAAALARVFDRAVEATLGDAKPATVRAYHSVYGHWPDGWPRGQEP